MASDYGEGIINRLHPDSPLRQEGNPARTLIMKTIGAWLDNYDVTELYDASFLETATGRWLDLYGNDLSVPRKLDESDDAYRTRLVYESIGNLSVDYLLNVFDLSLYSSRIDFDVMSNTLVSDNCFLNTGGYISVADSDVISVIDRKLLLDGSISWVNSYGALGYILNTQGIDILSHYSKIYNLSNLISYFFDNDNIKKVKLNLPNATVCSSLFGECSSLVNIDLSLPNASDCEFMFIHCSNLVNVDLSLPNASDCELMFADCSSLVNVDLNLPSATDCSNMFNSCSNLVSFDLNLPNATTCYRMFIHCSNLVNVDLSLPNASDCELMFADCSSLVNVKLNLPKLSNYTKMFRYVSSIETIDVTIPTGIVNGFKSYVLGLNLQHLTSFIINGDEQL